MRVCLLAGGTGGAKLASGLDAVLAPGDLTVIANTGDDLEIWGVHVSPDVDAVLYRLAGLFNDETGFGVAKDSFAVLDMMRSLGEPDWFWLGDRDLGVQLLRTRLLREGRRHSEICLELCARFGLASVVLPMSDDPVRTWFQTDLGRMPFQEYFVREKARPEVRAVTYEGLDQATGSPEALSAIEMADLIVIGPSNPLISIEPILRVLGDAPRPAITVAVSPIVGGAALKGPTIEMMRSTGREPTALGVAAEYAGRAAGFILDHRDREHAVEIEKLGYRVQVTDTVMAGPDQAALLATAVLSAAAG